MRSERRELHGVTRRGGIASLSVETDNRVQCGVTVVSELQLLQPHSRQGAERSARHHVRTGSMPCQWPLVNTTESLRSYSGDLNLELFLDLHYALDKCLSHYQPSAPRHSAGQRVHPAPSSPVMSNSIAGLY